MKNILLTVAAVALTLGGCSPRDVDRAQPNPEERTPAVTESEKPGVNAPGDLNPAEAQMRIDDVTLGHEVGSDGAIVAGKTGDDFAPGETIHLSMEVGDTPAGSAIKVVWFGPGDTRMTEDTKPVAAGAKYLTFSTKADGWAIGDYRAEVWVGDEKVNTQQFQIVQPADAGK
jgi:hypothetical protein